MAASVISLLRSFFPSGFRLVDAGDLQLLAALNNSAVAGLASTVGGTAVTSTPLSAALNQIDTSTGSNTDSLQMPPATPGQTVKIFNNTANTIKIWAQGADMLLDKGAIGAGATSITIATALLYEFSCLKAGFWKASSSA